MDRALTEQLVKGVISKDAAKEKLLYDSFATEVEFLVKLKIGQTNPDWRDLVQDIFVAFFQRIRDNQYDPHRGTLGAFLQSTIKFKIMDYIKSPRFSRRNAYDDLDGVPLEAPDPDPQRTAEAKQLSAAIGRAVQELDEPYKKILYLIVYKQYKVSDVSRLLGLSQQRISNMKSYALSMLKKKLVNDKDFLELL